MSKDLQDKAINIKGKKYVLVADRINYFNSEYPNASIITDYELVDNMFIVKAIVKPVADSPQTYTGLSQAVIGDGMVNKTAALENAETSAVGRALALMGIGVIDGIASVDEINKATGATGEAFTPTNKMASVGEVASIMAAAKEFSGLGTKEAVDTWFYEKCGMHINQVKHIEVPNVLKYIEEERDVYA